MSPCHLQELPLAVFRDPHCFCTWTSSLFSLNQQTDNQRCSGNDTGSRNLTGSSQQDHFQVYHTPVLGKTSSGTLGDCGLSSLTCLQLASREQLVGVLTSMVWFQLNQKEKSMVSGKHLVLDLSRGDLGQTKLWCSSVAGISCKNHNVEINRIKSK